MKADYKNWMPQGMINGFAAATAVCWLVFWLVNNVGLITAQTVRRGEYHECKVCDVKNNR